MNKRPFLKENILPLLALFIVIYVLLLVPAFVFLPYPKEHEALANLVIGFLSGVTSSVITFYFGSSAGSSKKDELINHLTGNTNNEVKETAPEPANPAV